MGDIRNILLPLWRDRSGISSTEYAMLTAVIALVVVVAIGQLSSAVSDTMDRTVDCLDGIVAPSSC